MNQPRINPSFRRFLAAADAARLKIEREQQALDAARAAERNRLLLAHMIDRCGYYAACVAVGIAIGVFVCKVIA